MADDDKLVMGNTICNNKLIHIEGSYFGNVYCKIFGEYLSTTEILNSISDNINSEREQDNDSEVIFSNDLIHQHKLISILKLLPVIKVDSQYLSALNDKKNEQKQCIICIEEFELNTIIKTLPCCIY